MQKRLIICIIFLIIIATVIVVFNVSIETEYIPETEISENEYRKTLITLYYKNSSTNSIESETKLIDSKELLIRPYDSLIEYLIRGSDNGNYKSFPEGLTVLNTNLKEDVLTINFSNEFLDIESEEELKENIICIQKTVAELKEINKINIIVDNSENEVVNRIIKENEL